MMTASRMQLALVLLAGFAARGVWADRQDVPAADPLQGPSVQDRDTPGTSKNFGEPMMLDKFNRSGRLPPRAFIGAVRSLASEELPEDVRATPEQIDQVRGIMQEFEAELRAFREEHRDEIDRLREAGGAALRDRRAGRGRPGADEAPESESAPTPEQQAAREELRALMEKGPKPDPYQDRVWALLNEKQQAHVRAKLEETQARLMEERQEPLVRDAIRDQAAKRDPRLQQFEGLSREEIRAKLRELPAEEREELLKKWREQRGGPARRGGPGGRAPQVEDKPAPDSDEVQTPL